MPDAKNKQYLGDAVYADFQYDQIVLTTEDGIRDTNTIYLEPQVFEALIRYGSRFFNMDSLMEELSGGDDEEG